MCLLLSPGPAVGGALSRRPEGPGLVSPGMTVRPPCWSAGQVPRPVSRLAACPERWQQVIASRGKPALRAEGDSGEREAVGCRVGRSAGRDDGLSLDGEYGDMAMGLAMVARPCG